MDLNELDVEWIGESRWAYRTKLDVPNMAPGAKAVLIFEGLDTFAEVRLDDKIILESDNMFLSHEVDITSFATSKGPLRLEIEFDSALLRGRELEKLHPEHRFLAHNGETGRLAVRKAQYHWGWDWGPILMTAGPWRPIHLDIFAARVVDHWLESTVSNDLKSVEVVAFARSDCPPGCAVNFSLALDGEVIHSQEAVIGQKGHSEAKFEIQHPALWYPRGYGAQSRYKLCTSIHYNGQILDSHTKCTSFRKVELMQEKDDIGESFFFRINSIDVFCGGSCWIPADSLLPNIAEQRYREWLQLMVDANQVMVRIWGGGIYEDDCFYDICDELGLLVWQDFMFGCGSYPVWPELLDSIQKEAVQNVRRLRHHPCIVIWAGNNEDYQIQEEYNLDYDPQDKNPGSWLKTNFPARYIYEHLLPEVVAAESPSVPYWPASPFSRGKNTADPTIGDIHQWNGKLALPAHPILY